VTETRRKQCLVAYATAQRQYLWPVELAAEADVAAALAAARRAAEASGCEAQVPWDNAPVGIFGEPCTRAAIPLEGDRIELYRPLAHDPRQSRRQRVQRARAPRSAR
jgi:putative ubiquitin-RnfH superfamily antitoxin RatB of RatAB toxin-antitoxin module